MSRTFQDIQAEQRAIPEPPLPEGARLVEPRTVKTGGWVEMEVDAELEFGGITWLRAKGGFGDGQRKGWHPREDWIADVPEMSVHVGRSWSKPDEWKHDKFCSMDDAMRAAIRANARYARERVFKDEHTLLRLRRGLAELEKAESA